MGKYERIIKIPALVIDRETAEQISGTMHDLAETRVMIILRERLTEAYRQPQNLLPAWGLQPELGNLPVDVFLNQYVQSEAYRELIRPTFGDKYTFLSPHGNVQYLFNDFEFKDIPPDVVTAIGESTGPSGEILNLNLKANPQPNEFGDPNLNRIMIQGPNSSWVNDIYQRLDTLVQKRKEPIRTVVYRWRPFFIWGTFFLMVVLEYKTARLTSGFQWNATLNGLQLLAIFALFVLTLVGAANIFNRLLPYLYPYFEFEGNISTPRRFWRKPVIAAVSILYAAAITALFAVK